MKKAIIPALFLLISLSSFAQTDDAKHRTKLAALNKDTAFKRFQSEFNTIMKTADKSNTNFARIKTLFTTNGVLLKSFRTKYNLQKRTLTTPKNSIGVSKIRPALFSKVVETVMYTTPYTAKVLHPNTTTIPVEISPDDQSGKIIWTHTTSPGDSKPIPHYIHCFKQTINVPANPVIVAVRLKFYYSYFLTGWDSEVGMLGTSIRISAGSGFNSPAYNNMTINNQTPELMNWRTINGSDYYQGFQEMHDYTQTKDTSFEIEGYVVPGTTLDFKFGIVHYPGSYTGDFGAYHYGEYQLKKIEVNFLKAGN
jgi:hypothetical protein